MAVPTDLTALSVTAASNSPSGSDSIGVSLDDFLRIIQAMLKEAGATLYTAAGTADVITFSTTPTFSAYQTGQRFYFLASGANTGAVTLNINAVGAKAVTREGTNALVAGDIPASAVVCVVYDGTRFILQNVANSYGKFNGSTVTASGLIAAQLGLTVTGAAFTSRGITDNATATALTIDSSSRIGVGATDMSVTGKNATVAIVGTVNLDDGNTISWGGTTGRTSITGSKAAGTLTLSTASSATGGAITLNASDATGTIQFQVGSTEVGRIINNGTTTLGGTTTAPAFKVVPGGSNVTWLEANGDATTPYLISRGGTNVGMSLVTLGTGSMNFVTGGNLTQAQVAHTASANRYITLTGSNGGNPTIGTSAGNLAISSTQAIVASATATPAGGTAGTGLCFGTTANLGVFFGSGSPTLSAAQGSLYLRTDGSSTSTRMYVNTNGTTGWTAVTTAT